MTDPNAHAGETSTIDDLDVAGQRVLLRVDLNVPLDTDSAGARHGWPMTPVSAQR